MSSENPENLEQPQKTDRYKRKRKKSVLKNARKYGKKGYYGRGNQLDSDTYQYLINAMEEFKQLDPNTDRTTIADVFEHLEGQELTCVSNQLGCRVVEMLLPYADNKTLEKYMTILGEEIRPLCDDRFASHVMEALVTVTCKYSFDSESDIQTTCKNFVLKVSKFLLNNLEDYVWNNYGSHVIITCLRNLAQLPKEDDTKLFNKVTDSGIKEEVVLPDEYVEIVRDYAQRILCWPQFNDLCINDITCRFLQMLLKALKRVDSKLLKQYINRLLNDVFSPNNENEFNEEPGTLPPVFSSTPSLMLLEACIRLAPKKLFLQIYCKLFAGRLPRLAVMRSTNFSVQNLLVSCKQKVEFEGFIEELKDSFENILSAGNTAILLALAQGCKRFSTSQGLFVKSLMTALNCYEPDDRQTSFVVCLSKLVKYDQNQKGDNLEKAKLSLHGTLILQAILDFKKPIKVVNSILSMDAEMLKNLFSNTMGSHIVDSYVNSQFVGERSREKLTYKLKDFYQELVSSKYGSRSFEALWKVANLKQKLMIMEELKSKERLWSSSDHGKIIAAKVNLKLYNRNLENWKNSISKSSKV